MTVLFSYHTCRVWMMPLQHYLFRLSFDRRSCFKHWWNDVLRILIHALDDFSSHNVDFLDSVAWEFNHELTGGACLGELV